MRFRKYIISLSTLLLLTGCGLSSDLRTVQSSVDTYNQTVEQTLTSYETVKAFAEIHKEDMIAYVTKDTEWGLYSDLEPLEDLATTYTVAMDEYFTAFGADTVREVLVLNSDKNQLYVTVIWAKDKVNAVTRELKGYNE